MGKEVNKIDDFVKLEKIGEGECPRSCQATKGGREFDEIGIWGWLGWPQIRCSRFLSRTPRSGSSVQ